MVISFISKVKYVIILVESVVFRMEAVKNRVVSVITWWNYSLIVQNQFLFIVKYLIIRVI